MKSRQEQNGMVFNLQRFCIHDGPGIRTTVFLKGCPLRCFWCQNPESQSRKPELFFNQDNCTACGRCVAVCPAGANRLGDSVAQIDREKCRGCGICVEACPNGARSLMGRLATVGEIMQEVTRDKNFYKNSGGGVTLSGGEPTAQAEFALSLLMACKEEGIHTVLETCGYTPWPAMKKLLEFTDLVLYDIKCMEQTMHLEATGKPNGLILENAVRVAEYKPIKIRVPIIPGWNDNPEEIKAIARFVKDKLGLRDLELLPYNNMGESKYQRLGRAFAGRHAGSEERLDELRQIVNDLL